MAKKQIPYYEEADFISTINDAVIAQSEKLGVNISRNEFISMAVKKQIKLAHTPMKTWE
jgi:hypothetical protein